MAMLQGSVVIADDGTETASGAAEAIYDDFIANHLADTGVPLPNGADAVPIKRSYATIANRVAVLITYIQTNGKAVIGSGVAELQRDSTDALTRSNGFAINYLPIA